MWKITLSVGVDMINGSVQFKHHYLERMNDVNSSSNADEKARIRDKYRDSSSEGIEVIPAIGEIDFYSDVSSKRVAVYARVSTDDSRQTSSFELQQSHYEDIVRRLPGW